MPGLLECLKSGEVLTADGAMGSLLIERGLPTGDCPERWNLDHPEVLEEIAGLYAEAGAQIVQTNTFGGSPLKLSHYGLDNCTEQINVAAVRAVRRAVGTDVLVSASCGPTGRMLKPYGDVEPEEISAAFERQIRAVLAEGVDMICIETMTDLGEATLAIKAARSLSSTVPIAATMTFDPTPRGFFTVMGVTIEQATVSLAEAGADIVGSNCGNGIDNMVAIAEEFQRHSDRPILIQSNAGLPEIVDNQIVYGENPEFMAARVPRLLGAGVGIIGGCCGTTPAHITALRTAIGQHRTG